MSSSYDWLKTRRRLVPPRCEVIVIVLGNRDKFLV